MSSSLSIAATHASVLTKDKATESSGSWLTNEFQLIENFFDARSSKASKDQARRSVTYLQSDLRPEYSRLSRPFKATTLYKLGDLIRKWRVVQLVAKEGRLYWYLQTMSREPLGCIFLQEVEEDGVQLIPMESLPSSEEIPVGSSVLRIRTSHRSLYFYHEDYSALEKWVEYLRDVREIYHDIAVRFTKPPNTPMLTGYLWKQGGVVKNWKKRFFMLRDNVLAYKSDPLDKNPRGTIDLRSMDKVELFETEERILSPLGVSFRTKERVWYLYHPNEEEIEDWVEALYESMHMNLALARLNPQEIIYRVSSSGNMGPTNSARSSLQGNISPLPLSSSPSSPYSGSDAGPRVYAISGEKISVTLDSADDERSD